jgi:hypothetical protein
MKVWVYSGQHDLEVDIAVFSEQAKEKAREFALSQKQVLKKRLVYTLDLIKVTEA